MFKEIVRDRLQTLARILSGRGKLTLAFGRTSKTDLKNITLRYMDTIVPGVPASRGECLLAMKAACAHEAGHIHFTSDGVMEEAVKRNPVLGTLLNIIEDARIERCMANAYPGTLTWFRFLNDYIFIHRPDWGEGPRALLGGLNAYAVVGRVPEKIDDTEILKLIEKCAPVIDRGRLEKDTRGALECAGKVWEIIKNYVESWTPSETPAMFGSGEAKKAPPGSLDPRRKPVIKPIPKTPEESGEKPCGPEESKEDGESGGPNPEEKPGKPTDGRPEESEGTPGESEGPEETSEAEDEPGYSENDEPPGCKEASETPEEPDSKEDAAETAGEQDSGEDAGETSEEHEGTGESSGPEESTGDPSDKAREEEPEEITGMPDDHSREEEHDHLEGPHDYPEGGSEDIDGPDEEFTDDIPDGHTDLEEGDEFPDEDLIDLGDYDELLEAAEDEMESIESAAFREEKSREPESASIDPEEIMAEFSKDIHHGCRLVIAEKFPVTESAKLEYEKLLSGVKPYVNKTVQEIRKILEYRATLRERGLKKGKLDCGALWKLATKDPGVFYKVRQPNDIPKLAMSLLVDCSGSMGHPAANMEKARQAACLLAEACHALKIPVSVTGFTAQVRSDNEVNHYRVLSFNEADRYKISYLKALCQNRDGYSIRVAAKELELRPEEKKVLVVLSDGLPLSPYMYYHGSMGVADTAKAVRWAEKRGIGVIGLFFGSEGDLPQAQIMYNNLIFVPDIEVLPQTVGRVLKKVIQNL